MPSRYEPCGLGQMIAMRYGSIPVVQATGGLADTVVDIETSDEGTGIVLNELSAAGLSAAMERVRTLLNNGREALKVRRRGMDRDFSWAASARSYVELYRAVSA
jgi:starch synthase